MSAVERSDQSRRDERILEVVRSLREGDVVTYGEIADDAGFPKMSRLVGRLLSQTSDADLAWWRVVSSTGRLVPGHEQEQAELLSAEGVLCANGRVVHAPNRSFQPGCGVGPGSSTPARSVS